MAVDQAHRVQDVVHGVEKIVDSAERIGADLGPEFSRSIRDEAGSLRIPENLVAFFDKLLARGIKKVEPHKVIRVLEHYNGRTILVGHNSIRLTRERMKHILERHHPEYWGGKISSEQSFFPKNSTIESIENAIEQVINQNRDAILAMGTNAPFRLIGVIDGIEHILTIDRGSIVQFFSKHIL